MSTSIFSNVSNQANTVVKRSRMSSLNPQLRIYSSYAAKKFNKHIITAYNSNCWFLFVSMNRNTIDIYIILNKQLISHVHLVPIPNA